MLSNVCLPSNDSCAHDMYVDITVKICVLSCANVGVMFEHSYYTCECGTNTIAYNSMGVRCSLPVTALFLHCET